NKLSYASPVVTSDKIYMALKSGEVKVYNRADGGDVATYKFPDEVNSTPAIAANGFLYVGCDDGGLYAVDTKTGVVAWKYMTEDSVQSSPALTEDGVFIASKDGNIYAFSE
ncbi:MAG TPA: PQQ-binding-like beta-propeller repeat protein, partial [Thermodesulfobacteriota bacterium]